MLILLVAFYILSLKISQYYERYILFWLIYAGLYTVTLPLQDVWKISE